MRGHKEFRIYSRWQILVAITPGLFLFLLFVIYPAVANLFYSFTDYKPLAVKATRWIWIDNYVAIFTQTQNYRLLLIALKNTMIISLLVSSIQNVVAVIFAVLLNHRIRLRNLYRAIIFLPGTLGVVIQGLVWTLALDPYNGPYARVLESFGLKSAYFGDPKLALYLVIMIIIWANIGFAMTIYLAGLQTIPHELYEAGRIDGASSLQMLRHITLPLLRSSITVNVLLSIIGSINMLDIIIVTTNGGPGFSTYNLPLYVFYCINSSGGAVGMKTQGYAAAVSIIQFAATLVFVLIAQRILRSKEVEV